jgi:hypothetical protein
VPSPPQPRFTSIEDLQYYLRSQGQDVPRQTVLAWTLAGAEVMVERYCRRRFSPEPALRTDYQRQVVSVFGQGQTNVLQLAGTLAFSLGGNSTGPLTLPITASQLQAALRANITGLSQVTCGGGPLPTYPINVYMIGVPNATSQPQALLAVDSSGISPAGMASVYDAGFDSNPPVARRYTTRGMKEIRVMDLRAIDPEPDPRIPSSGGIYLYGRRLLPNQYFTGYGSYAPGGADEAIGVGDYAEPADRVILGYGYGLGMTLAQQFAYVLPQMYLANDATITGRWGWNPTPPDIIDATYAVAARRYRERDASFSDQIVTPEGMALAFFKTLPASVKGALDAYRVPNIGLLGAGGGGFS